MGEAGCIPVELASVISVREGDRERERQWRLGVGAVMVGPQNVQDTTADSQRRPVVSRDPGSSG